MVKKSGLELIIGGAYQGKLTYALEQYYKQCGHQMPVLDDHKAGEVVFTCSDSTTSIDFSCPIIDRLHLLIWARQQAGLDTLSYLKVHRQMLNNHWLILDDLSAGIVPIDAATRLWRENTGRCSVYLAQEAARVQRLFCGLATQLKP